MKTLPIEVIAGCWIWQRRTDKEGYGRVADGHLAHRVVYEQLVGPIPSGLQLDHLCFNPPCVNPDHLEPVTNAENQRRASDARTHCTNGHEFTPENTGYRSGGSGRVCRACSRDRVRRYRQRKRATVRGRA